MENNLTGQADENQVTSQNIISAERKVTIIDLMFQKTSNATFSKNREVIKSFPLITEEEKKFIDEVYEIIKQLNEGENVLEIANRQQLIEEVYARCQISREVATQVRGQRAAKAQKSLDRIQEEREEIDAKIAAKYGQESSVIGQQTPDLKISEEVQTEPNQTGQVGYKEDLYQPETLCGQSRDVAGQPFVKHIHYSQERIVNISPKIAYQFADRVYSIKKVGALIYMPTPNLEDYISEYEITISKGDISRTVTRFGQIDFHKMKESAYNAVVFLQLLNHDNLTDKELHGYIGSLEQVRDENGKLKDKYRIVHSPEEYTAVAIWEQVEKARVERNEKVENKGERAAGGEDR